MAASTTWPLPDRAAASSMAHTTPKASSMPPPPKSPMRLSGGTGRTAVRPDGVQRAGERDVVDVVAGGLRERTLLTPARHASVDQAWIALEADSAPSPRRSMTPGRKPSIRASACRTMRRTVVIAACFFKSSASDRRPRFNTSNFEPHRPSCADRCAPPRRPCRPASWRRRVQARCPRSRSLSFPQAVPSLELSLPATWRAPVGCKRCGESTDDSVGRAWSTASWIVSGRGRGPFRDAVAGFRRRSRGGLLPVARLRRHAARGRAPPSHGADPGRDGQDGRQPGLVRGRRRPHSRRAHRGSEGSARVVPPQRRVHAAVRHRLPRPGHAGDPGARSRSARARPRSKRCA